MGGLSCWTESLARIGPGRKAARGCCAGLASRRPRFASRGRRPNAAASRYCNSKGETDMRLPAVLKGALAALTIFIAAGQSSAHADEGFITLTIYKGGWFIGGSAGGGTLRFRGRSYPVSVGGIDYG